MASQQTVVPVGVKPPMDPRSCPLELPVARDIAQEAASPTGRMVKALQGTGLQTFDGRPSSPHPQPQKHCRGRGAKEGHPPHTQYLSVWRPKCQARPSGKSYTLCRAQGSYLCNGTQIFRTGLLGPQGPPNQKQQRPPEGSTQVPAGTAGSPSSQLHFSLFKRKSQCSGPINQELSLRLHPTVRRRAQRRSFRGCKTPRQPTEQDPHLSPGHSAPSASTT